MEYGAAFSGASLLYSNIECLSGKVVPADELCKDRFPGTTQ